jgi:hypothetical protein
MRGARTQYDILTLVDDGDSVSVVYQRRQSAQIVLVSQFFVRDLDEADSQRVGLVVDVLEFLQCFIRFSALWLICNGIFSQSSTHFVWKLCDFDDASQLRGAGRIKHPFN